jgi:hypothetical protein
MSLLKKFYPRSPEPYIGKRLGDNYVAKLADINELIAQIEELYASTPPGSGLASVAVNSPLTGTGTIGDPITLSGSVAGTDFDVEATGSGITITKNGGTYGVGPINIQAEDVLQIQVQSIPNGLNWKGVHSTATTYQLNDVVFKLVDGLYYSYWCYAPGGAPAGTQLPTPPTPNTTIWAQLGLQGPAGTNGATWYSGATPGGGSSSSAVNNDYFLVTSGANSGAIFKKTGNTWGGTPILDITGPAGPTGAAGAKWTSGSGIPTGGVDGDFYLRNDGVVWSKNSGSWGTTSINLKGAAGADGDDGLDSTVPGPQGPTNVVVRLYQRTATSSAPNVPTTGTAVYTFSSNGITAQPSGWTPTIPTSGGSYIWEIQAVASSSTTTANISNLTWTTSPSLIGLPGAQGNNGTAAGFGTPTASALPSGSPPTVTASGPDTARVFTFGIPAGAVGPAGADGKTILNGNVIPTASIGNIGDFYINTNADTIYGPKESGGWGSATSLVGPQGPAGTAPTVIAFTVDGYGAPITLNPGKTVFTVNLPFKFTYNSLSVTLDLPGGGASAATMVVTGSGGASGTFTATINNTTSASIPPSSITTGSNTSGTVTFVLTTTAAMAATYVYVSLSGTRG